MDKDKLNPGPEEKATDNSTLLIGTGMGLGAYATATTLLAGFTCPICAVSAPVLIATGLYQKIKNRKNPDKLL